MITTTTTSALLTGFERFLLDEVCRTDTMRIKSMLTAQDCHGRVTDTAGYCRTDNVLEDIEEHMETVRCLAVEKLLAPRLLVNIERNRPGT
jgi:hypothetical protein